MLLMEEHQAAFEYDWRTRFHLPLRVVGTEEMSWGEALRHTKTLRKDPASAVAVAVEGWEHPITREALAMLDLFDVTVQVNSDTKKGRPKPHGGRPWKIDDRDRRKRGNAAGRSRADVVAILNAHGHNLPV